ncbi:MAG: hypothetical protein ABR613_11880 [Actinomycetota bacterium]
MRPTTLLVAAALVLGGCRSTPQAAPAATPPPTPTPAPTPVINPPGVIVMNEAFGESRRKVEVAIADLKDVDLWLRLTKHLYKIKFGSRLGAANIPEDRHLADVHLTGVFDPEAQGRFCDIRFYPNAIKQDLERWRLYYSQGLKADPPPTPRQFWGAITAHELAHCFPGGRGEKFAERWERKALGRLRELSR